MNFDFLINAFFPQRCVRCHITIKDGVICDNCRAKITLNSSFFCGKCRARLPEGKKICHKDFPYILGAAGAYHDETIRTLVHHLKFKGIRDAAVPLAEIIDDYISKLDVSISGYIIVPIPLSQKRLRERGFNQSQLIAEYLAHRLTIPIKTGTLARMRHASPQSHATSIFERKENVRGCFTVTVDPLRDKNVILIDDVTTSGATFYEAAQALKAAGAKKIIACASAMA